MSYIGLGEIVLRLRSFALILLISIVLSLHGLSLTSDYTISIQGLEIPQKEKRL